MNFAIAYFSGLVVGFALAWFIMHKRMELSPDMRDIVRDSCTQAAFVYATGEVCDEDTCERIMDRANDRLDELDIRGNPEWHYEDP